MEVNIEQTVLEDVALEDNASNKNRSAACSMHGENQINEASCTKSMKFDYDTRSTGTDNSHCNDSDEEMCFDNKDVLHNGLSQEDPEHNDDLRQFDVLDDLDRHPEQNEECSAEDSDTEESTDSEVPDEEIEAMLEEGI